MAVMKNWISKRRAIIAVILASIAVTASLASLQSALAGGEIGIERAIAAQEAHNPQFLAIEGVVGTGVSPGPGGVAVLVMIEHPGVVGIPAAVDGVPVRPVITGKISALHHCKGRHASAPECSPPPTPTPDPGNPTPTPIPGGPSGEPTDTFRPDVPNGVSIGHFAITAGTLGGAVTDGLGRTLVLSNNHVLADENNGSAGDPIMQAGPFDTECYPCSEAEALASNALFGTLEAFVPIDFNGGDNVVDAALAAPNPGVSLTGSTLSDGYGAPKSEIFPWQELTFRHRVQKYGRTTDQSDGRVFGVNVTVNVSYDSGVARFVKQIWIRGKGFSAGGDSGSLVVTSDRNPVGLLFAGGASDTFLNPIQDVVDALGVEIVGQ